MRRSDVWYATYVGENYLQLKLTEPIINWINKKLADKNCIQMYTFKYLAQNCHEKWTTAYFLRRNVIELPALLFTE